MVAAPPPNVYISASRLYIEIEFLGHCKVRVLSKWRMQITWAQKASVKKTAFPSEETAKMLCN